MAYELPIEGLHAFSTCILTSPAWTHAIPIICIGILATVYALEERGLLYTMRLCLLHR